MKLKTKLWCSSVVAAACTLAAALCLSDNQSLLFRLLMWAASILLLAAGTAGGVVLSFGVSKIVFGAYQLFNTLFDSGFEAAPLTKQRFHKWFTPIFFVVSLLIPGKFALDFTFAQTPGMFIFLSVAVGVAHGTFTAIGLVKREKKPEGKTIWIDANEKHSEKEHSDQKRSGEDTSHRDA